MIGPSGCGKSTFLRCLNRMNDTVSGCIVRGKIALDGTNIYGDKTEIVELRSRVGMVFQRPNPFPKSIYDNVPMAHAFMVWWTRAQTWMKWLSLRCAKPVFGKK